MSDNFTLCSLFDGSGGFPLAASFYGIEATTASEIEPYPIAVTRSRFPNMVHLGDISKINGAEIPPADIISFGSPCQDLSVAGKRAGLKHEDKGDDETTRSGLFMEAIRIIKEMREATHGRYPAFALWENVPGAFTSNRGRDFEAVLDEFIQIVEPGAEVPPAYKGRWPTADLYLGGGWSLAYRTMDAKYWGVPQRRRRIYLIMDFRGERAGEVLFKRDGLSRHFTEGGEKGEQIAGNAPESVGDPSGVIEMKVFTKSRHAKDPDDFETRTDGETASTLNTFENSNDKRATVLAVESHPSKKGTGGNNTPMILYSFQAFGDYQENEETSSLKARDYKNATDLVAEVLDCRNLKAGHISGTLQAKPNGGQSLNYINPVSIENDGGYKIRRLTPLECCRLQGFPDGWGDIDIKEDLTDEEFKFWSEVRKTHAEIMGRKPREYTRAQILSWYNGLQTDSNQYKMWGNGIALPCALYVFEGLAIELEKERKKIADNAKDNEL